MELDGIAVSGGLHTVFVGEGQDAVGVGVGTGVADIIGAEVELVGAGGIEGHGGAAVIGDDLHAVHFLGRSGFFSGFFRRGFLFGELPADDRLAAVIQRPDGLRHEVEHGGLVVGIVHAVGVIAVDVHLGSALHLSGVGVRLHFKDRVIGLCCGDRTVRILHIAALGHGGEHQAQAGIVSDHGAFAALNNITVNRELIGAVIELQRSINVETAVGADHAGEVGAEELEAGHVVHVLIALVVGDLVHAGCGTGPAGCAGSGGAAAQEAAHREAGDQYGRKQQAADGVESDPAALATLFALVKAADDVENHRDQQQNDSAERHVDGLFSAMAGVIVGEYAVADALHAVTQQQDRAGGQQSGNAESEKLGPKRIRELRAQEYGSDGNKDACADQGGDNTRLHLTKGVIAGFVAQEEQQQCRQGQCDCYDAGAKLQRLIGFAHVHCLLSFRSARM